jgi:hypothetical protein
VTKEQAFAAGMGALASVFNRALDKTAIRAYELALGELSAEEMASATGAALKACRFMPTPAELLALGKPPRNLAIEAADAWEAVCEAMNRHDYTDSVDFGPLVNAVVRNLGGWIALCDATKTDLKFGRKGFERLYADFASKPLGALRGDPLMGSHKAAPVRIAIAGKLPPLQLASAPDPVRQVVRELAEAKSAPSATGVAASPVRGPNGEPFLPRPTRAPSRISADDKAAAVERIRQQLAARAAAAPPVPAPPEATP